MSMPTSEVVPPDIDHHGVGKAGKARRATHRVRGT